MQTLTPIAQHFGFYLSQICNWALLYLILTKTAVKFGAYKYLMISFACYALIYSAIEFMTLPVYTVSKSLANIQGVKLLKLFVLPIAFSILWYIIVNLAYLPSDIKSQYVRESFFEVYQQDSLQIAYAAVLYYRYDKDGRLIIMWRDCIGMGI
ncbi:unnamed protein product [Caenorhabditis bovis]|uniref:Uncharacterized protein n=1 Tax=Caenorhabditis bovis TaxID=2654633 RepID=A0A8S1E9R9_9PELO|nr:unnamed protein product [Caenorhabditis bovis]